eukprot:16412-Chlamydomonas_euryale.AAC.8
MTVSPLYGGALPEGIAFTGLVAPVELPRGCAPDDAAALAAEVARARERTPPALAPAFRAGSCNERMGSYAGAGPGPGSEAAMAASMPGQRRRPRRVLAAAVAMLRAHRVRQAAYRATRVRARR